MMGRARAVRGGLFQAPSLAGFLRVLPVGLGLSMALLYAVVLQLTGVARDQDVLLRFNDYPAFLTGARLVVAGQAALLYDPAAQEPAQAAIVGGDVVRARGLLPYNHLPFLALALAPLAGLPVLTSYAVWMAATALALALALALLTGELLAYERRRTPSTIWAAIGLWGLALGFLPLAQSLLVAQVTPWVLLGLAGATRALRAGHDGAAGAWLALGLLKPQVILVPLLVLLIMRRGRAVLAFGAVAAGGLALATLALGDPGWPRAYLALLGQVAGAEGAGAIQPVLMMNWRGLLAQAAATLGLSGPGGAAAWVFPLSLVLSALTVVGLGVAWLRSGWRPAGQATLPGPGARAWDLRWAATILAGLLASPHLPAYELALWLVPAVLLWRALRRPAALPPIAVVLKPDDTPAVRTTPGKENKTNKNHEMIFIDFIVTKLRRGGDLAGHAGNSGDLTAARVGSGELDPNRQPPTANPQPPYSAWRMPLLVLGYVAGVVALPLAGQGWLPTGALAMVVGIPLLLWLAARQARAGTRP
jgi:hypothetical protein